MRAVLLQPHHLTIVVGAPDHAALMIHARTGRTDQKHMTATGASLCADMVGIVAGITGPFHEDGDLLLRGDLIEHVVKQTCENPVAAGPFRDPEPAFSETKAAGKLHELRTWRDDVVKRRIRPRDRERLGLGWRTVAAHLRNRGSALRLRVRKRDTDHAKQNGVGPGGGLLHGVTSLIT